MRSLYRNEISSITLFFWLIALAGCMQPSMKKPTSTPDRILATQIPSDQVNMPAIQGTKPIQARTATVTPTQRVSVFTPFVTEIPLDTPPPGWFVFQGTPDGIYIIREDGSGERRILTPIDWVHPEFLSWSPDGQWISFIAFPSHNAGRDEIYIARPDGSGLRRLTYTSGYKRANSWSPDGKSIVYSQTIDGENGQIEVDLFEVDVETGQIHQITNTPDVYEHSPAYSPTGDTIAFISILPSEQPILFHLMIMDRNGSEARQLIDLPVSGGKIAWSPDGSYIAFASSSVSSEKCKEDLYIVNRDGSDLQRLTNRPGSVNYPSWSPNGQWIAFVYSASDSCVSGYQQITLIKVNGTGLRNLGDTFIVGPDPAWSPLPALQAGKTFTITEGGAQLKLRVSPSLTGEVLKKLDEYEQIFVLEGPKEADEYLWWRVQVDSSGQEGWVAENPGWFAGVEP